MSVVSCRGSLQFIVQDCTSKGMVVALLEVVPRFHRPTAVHEIPQLHSASSLMGSRHAEDAPSCFGDGLLGPAEAFGCEIS